MTARMRLAGKICCFCKSPLPPSDEIRERMCLRCAEERAPRRRIYMHFMMNKRWFCQFLEADLKTPLPRRISFSDEAKLFEMAERGGYRLNLEGRQAIEHAIHNGRGGIWLNLTDEQYAKLKENGRRLR